MTQKFSRRSILKAAPATLAGMGMIGKLERLDARARGDGTESQSKFKLGLVTYELAQDWDLETLIRNCEATGFEGVELRTTHRHGVEPSLSKPRREEVRHRFEDSHVRLVSLGSVCEYESPDPAVVRQNIEETRRFTELAHDLGAMGVKVRPNGFPPNVPHERTLEQIGHALAQCGEAAADLGVEIWLEVHNPGTQLPANIHRIMEVANHPAVGVCWNSNDTDVVNGSVKESFELLQAWLRSCHINELWRKEYPWRELFGFFRDAGYQRYTFAEIPASCEPLRLMRYYQALWQSLVS